MNSLNNNSEKIRDYCLSRTGLNLSETIRGQIEKFVSGRCHLLDLSIEAYLLLLEKDSVEYAEFITAITNNETYFFREERHYRALESEILTKLARVSCPVKMWSATCSTGEEPLSLYCIASEVLKNNFSIYATDIDRAALNCFIEGRYRPNSFREDGSSYHKLILKYSESNGTEWVFPRSIIESINIQIMNLKFPDNKDIPFDFDIIFFRNSLIYFGLDERSGIIDRIISRLRPGGYLFLSMTETALLEHPQLELELLDNVYYFRKKMTAKTGEVVINAH